MLLASLLSKYLFSAWLDQYKVTAHKGSSAVGKWNTKHSFNVDLHAQVDMQCCVWIDTHCYVQMN